MRVGVVTTSYPREEGDPSGNFVAGFARWLRDRGCEIDVIAAGPGAGSVDEIPVTRVDGRSLFYAGGAPDELARGGRFVWGRAARFQAEMAWHVRLRSRRWDRVVSHWLAPSGLAAAAAWSGPARHHLAIAHSSDVALLRRSRLGRAALRWLSKRSDLVYSARHLLIEGAPGRIAAMGIDPPTGGDRKRGRRRWSMRGTTALFLGRLIPIKGMDLLLEALPPSLSLLVAGEGPERERLEGRAASGSGRVRFLGEVRDPDKADLLAAADLLVVPSIRLSDGRTEGTPTVLLEALAAGLPIVATRASGADAIIADGVNGLLCDATTSSMAATLARLMRSRALRTGLGAGALSSAAAHFWPAAGPRVAGSLLE